MKKLLACFLVIALLLPALCLAEDTSVAWSFPLALKDINSTVLDLANSENPLPEDYAPDDLMTMRTRKNDADGLNTNGGIYMATTTKIILRRIAGNALVKLVNAAQTDGITLYARAGYRTRADQEKRYARAEASGKLDYVQKPGECDYETGLAVTMVSKEYRASELDESFATTAEAQWLAKNCTRFGFIIRYPEGKEDVTGNKYEPWHLRYVGPTVAAYITENNLTLEEFLDSYNTALDEFVAAGGDLEEALQLGVLPDGPVELDAVDSEGDHEITIFHD